MSASPVEPTRSACVRIAFRYLLVSILCAGFGAVYELFSHGVYSGGMLYAFLFPLVGGALPALWLTKCEKPLPAGAAQQLWHFGISALTVGSLFSGALQIYGTTSRLTVVYWLAGGACMLLALLTGMFLPAEKGEEIANTGM